MVTRGAVGQPPLRGTLDWTVVCRPRLIGAACVLFAARPAVDDGDEPGAITAAIDTFLARQCGGTRVVALGDRAPDHLVAVVAQYSRVDLRLDGHDRLEQRK